MLRVICFTIVYAGLAIGQEHHCESPLHFKTGLLQYDHLTKLYRKGIMFYDGSGERVRYIEETAVNQTRPAEDVLLLFKEEKEYVVDLKSKKCTKTTPRRPFHRIGVQEGYKLQGEFMIGDREDGVLMTSWLKQENSTDAAGMFFRTFTRKTCLPFEETFDGMVGKERVHYHRRYYDIEITELPHDAFNVPKECSTIFDDFLS